MNLAKSLASGAAELGLPLTPVQSDLLLAYTALLEKWNEAFNLTAVSGTRNILVRHILDSLSVSPYLIGERVLDVGSGAGLPGIPLAVMQPERRFVLLDSNGKKTRFIQQTILELKLDNVEVMKIRIGEYRPGPAFDTVISRAFADLRDFIHVSAPLCKQGGRLLAMKGRYPQAELRDLSDSVMLVSVKALQVPGLKAQRHLVWLEATKTQYD